MPLATDEKIALSASDFTVSGGIYSITLPDTGDYSFFTGNSIVIPSSEQYAGSNVVFSFSEQPDAIVAHGNIAGEDGRVLPIQGIIKAHALMKTKITLDSPPPPVPREQSQLQNMSVPLPRDMSFATAFVSGRKVTLNDTSDTYLNDDYSRRLKIPLNNTERKFISFCYITDERDELDSFRWKPPTAAMAEIWRRGSSDAHTRFGGMLLPLYVADPVPVEGMWNPFRYSTDSRRIEVFNSDYDMFGDEKTMMIVVRTGEIAFTDGIEYCCRMRYANGNDEHGRIIWRGWSPTVVFRLNVPPNMPGQPSMTAIWT